MRSKEVVRNAKFGNLMSGESPNNVGYTIDSKRIWAAQQGYPRTYYGSAIVKPLLCCFCRTDGDHAVVDAATHNSGHPS